MKSNLRLVTMLAVGAVLAAGVVWPGARTWTEASAHGATHSGDHSATRPSDDHLVVSLRPEADWAAQLRQPTTDSFRRRWGDAVKSATLVAEHAYVLEMASPEAATMLAQRLRNDASVDYTEPIVHFQAGLRPNDIFYDRQYGLPRIRAEQAWNISAGDSWVVIAVLDTGIAAEHPDLAPNVVMGYDFINNDEDSSDDEGHGTHTAGIAGAVGNNGRGVAGVCWHCSLLAVKVLDRHGSGSSVAVAMGIRHATDRGARVINLSLGGPNDSRLLHEAVRYANSRGVLVVVAAGNDAQRGNLIEYPAAYPEVVAVAAIDRADRHAPFSSYHDYVDVAAPGVDVVSTSWVPSQREAYDVGSGTSAATPFVAGLAGLLWSHNPALTNEDVRTLILSTADDLGDPGVDPYFGAGRINAYRALRATRSPCGTTLSRPAQLDGPFVVYLPMVSQSAWGC